MKVLFRTLILLLAVSLLFSSNVLAKNEQAKLSLVSLGDSIPYGYDLGHNNNANPSKLAFPYLIGEEADMRVRNLAAPGWTTSQMLNTLKNDLKYRDAVRHADFITLNIGSNDLLQALAIAKELSGGDPTLLQGILIEQAFIAQGNISHSLSEIIKEINSLTDAPIIVYNIYNPFQTDPLLYEIGNAILFGINEQISQITTGSNVVVANAFGNFDKKVTYLIPDNVHPSAEGQRELAKLGIDLINALK